MDYKEKYEKDMNTQHTLSINDLLLEKWLRKRNNKELVWTTKTGERIPLCEMTDQHLENVINHLERKEMVIDALSSYDFLND